MTDLSLAADRFRRDELTWSLNRIATLINTGRIPLPSRHAGPIVIDFTVPRDGVDQAAASIGREPQQYKDEYFVTLDGEELRVRWSAHSPADPVGHLYGRGDEGQDPQPAAGRLPAHLEDGVTGEVEMVDTAAADEPACHGAPAGFEAYCGVAGPHGPHGVEPASVE